MTIFFVIDKNEKIFCEILRCELIAKKLIKI